MKREKKEVSGKLSCRVRARVGKSHGDVSVKKKKLLHVDSQKHDRKSRKKSAESASLVVSASADCVMERAKEIQSSLPPELPTFIKSMLPSHVAGGFWLGLPKRFCDLHLPKQNSPVFLEDEDGKVYETKYLSEKVGLSAGWRGYSIAHGLREGDVLVFQLVEPCHWKVFLSRTDNLDEVDGALSLLQLFPSCKGLKKRKYEQMGGKSSPEMSRKMSVEVLSPEQDRPEEADQVSEILDGIRLCEFRVRFEDIKQAADFVVAVDGLVISGELTTYVRNKYYNLCLSKKHFLHENLVKGLNCKLVVGIISETVNIADAIHSAKVTISAEDFKVWETTLRAFQDLGMDVGFLLTRLGRLMTLAAVWKSLTDEQRNADEKLVEAENIASLELIFQADAMRKW
ncbi:hypothetical protein MLD38_019607 [Melastoma candidum]|uniref:Uncharacterized protein n=1 Tax=Melastoma candidum TaxID=119954 RepID=A0ACB9R5T9_9MYRT|nr:hypothetical protein MLD38_019607 [Melastoma candidum]